MFWLRLLHKKNHRGVSAVEVVVGVSLAATVLTFVTHTLVRFVSVGSELSEKTNALYMAEEALELVRFVRDDTWANISGVTDGVTYYVEATPTTVSVTTTPEVIAGYYNRSFTVESVYRDANDDIVASTSPGSNLDTGAKYVTSQVTWGTPLKTIELTTILVDISQP